VNKTFSTPRSAVRIAVLDYGSGNLHSVCQALAAVGADVVLGTTAGSIVGCGGLLVPGVGAFSTCAAGLQAVAGYQLIRDWLAADRPVLGICVGHQIMFTAGKEHGVSAAGVGVLPGVVEQLPAVRLPHMGWNTVTAAADTQMFKGVETERFYFLHSYALRSLHGLGVTWGEHGGVKFVAAVERGALWGVQFHPEKSGAAGAKLLSNWVALVSRGVNHELSTAGNYSAGE
jgi:glutamine amidotransferase